MGSIVGGIIGQNKAEGMYSGAGELSNKALQELQKVGVPSVQEQEIQNQQLQYLGQYTPEQQQAIAQAQSAMGGITTDPRLQQAQMQALQTLTQMGQVPLTDTERMQLNQMQRDVAAQEQARQQSILQSLQQRGMGGSGQELAARLSSSQGAANAAQAQSDQIAAMAQQRALQAIGQAGTLGGQMQAQSFGQQAQQAQAQDVINAFNIANRRDIQSSNVGLANQLGAQAQTERQRIAETNVGLSNQQQQYNKQLLQQQFQNQMQKATGTAGIYQNQAAQQMQAGQATAQSYAQMGQGVDTAIVGGIKAFNPTPNVYLGAPPTSTTKTSDIKAKKNIESFDPNKFLDSINGYTYDYKNPKYGEEKQIGVMAQDIEKTVPQVVSKNEEGLKTIDYDKLSGPILASLAELHKKIKELEKKK